MFVAGTNDRKFCRIGKHLNELLRNDDQIVSNSKKQDINMFQRSRFIEISDCGHAVHLERPIILTEILRLFLE